ncbi:GNAT family N-acetyltransferase [Clostridium grantii]|uniref:Putative acetyltransferase n=1 Tax=Clostridium grantii DSM 8605 TaxID=1121316 RepID=A0A1M5QZ49_9CLOT|nr:GNAT family N-acetyltransferase [Clostridium grantii]SHH19362.1 putative acetyltransferase [Clostridium grantii DSM 8605]
MQNNNLEKIKSSYTIRAVQYTDVEDIYNLRIMDGVRENTMSLFSQTMDKTENFIKNLSSDDHVMVAEIEENGVKKVIGIAALNIMKSPRARHSGSLGISIHADYQGIGVGKALMGKLIDLADNWLMLVRIELGVFTDNMAAIKLYEHFGFVKEGEKKYALIRNGKYENEYLMARYNDKLLLR